MRSYQIAVLLSLSSAVFAAVAGHSGKHTKACHARGCRTAFSAIPSCATNPYQSAASSFGCGKNDYGCQCDNIAPIINQAGQTIASSCGDDNIPLVTILADYQSACSCVSSRCSSSPPTSIASTDFPTMTPPPPVTCDNNGCSAIFSQIPACGTDPINSAASSAYGCASTDYACQCSNLAGIANNAGPAVASSCTNGELVSILAEYQSGCSCVSSCSPPPTTSPPPVTCDASGCSASFSAIPSCATNPYQSAASSYGCASTDYACQCSNVAPIFNEAGASIASSCGDDNIALASVVSDYQAACSCVSSCSSPPTTSPPPVTCDASGCSASFSAIPSCATNPYQSAASSYGCASTDYACQCSNVAPIFNQAGASIASSCGDDNIALASVVSDYQAACECVSSCSSSPTTTPPSVTCDASGCSASFSAIPSCATNPYQSVASSFGCVSTDYACQCNNANPILNQAAASIGSSCGDDNVPLASILVDYQSACACVTSSCSGSATSVTQTSSGKPGKPTKTGKPGKPGKPTGPTPTKTPKKPTEPASKTKTKKATETGNHVTSYA